MKPPRTIDPGDYVGIVGQSFLKHERRPLLQIGTTAWSRWSLGRLGCPHPIAAANLNRICQQLGITSVRMLAARAREIGTYQGIGLSAYWIVLAILRDAGYDVQEIHGESVTYTTVKTRARQLAAKQRPRLRRRRAGPPSEAAAAEGATT